MANWKNIRLLTVVSALMAVACGGKDSPVSPTPAPVVNPRLTAPAPDTPADDEQLGTLRPTLTVRNGTSDQSGTRTYEFQIADKSDFSTAVGSFVASYAVTVTTRTYPTSQGR